MAKRPTRPVRPTVAIKPAEKGDKKTFGELQAMREAARKALLEIESQQAEVMAEEEERISGVLGEVVGLFDESDDDLVIGQLSNLLGDYGYSLKYTGVYDEDLAAKMVTRWGDGVEFGLKAEDRAARVADWQVDPKDFNKTFSALFEMVSDGKAGRKTRFTYIEPPEETETEEQ